MSWVHSYQVRVFIPPHRGNTAYQIAVYKVSVFWNFLRVRATEEMSPTAVTFNDLSLPPNGPGSLSSLQYWMEGFTLQTLVYGINIVLFLSTMWVLGIHIFKALAHTHKFHRLHLWQNYVLTVYTVVMFALSSIFMGRQGIMADGAWQSVFREEGIDGIAENIFSDDAAPRRVCHAALILINWGTVAILVSVSPLFLAVIDCWQWGSRCGDVRYTGKSVLHSHGKSWRFRI